MPELQLRGTSLGHVNAVLFDKDGTMSRSEPELVALAETRVLLCLQRVEGQLRGELRELLQRAYGLQQGTIHPAGTTAVASREHNLISTATARVQMGLGWPEALALSEAVFAEADATDARRSAGNAAQATSAPTEGLPALLEELRRAGLICAVISNDDNAGIQHFLDSHNLGAYFSGIWSAEHRPRKPDPAAVHGLCGALGVDPVECALIGDANSDLRMAVAAGIRQGLALGYMAGWSQPPPLMEPHPRIHHWGELQVALP
jgi:phosphoglycolate phosphatase